MTLQELAKELDNGIVSSWDQYLALNSELDKYRGQIIDESNSAQVNDILTKMQDTFKELYPALYFITYRHQSATNMIASYNDFIETLKKAGAVEGAAQEAVVQ